MSRGSSKQRTSTVFPWGRLAPNWGDTLSFAPMPFAGPGAPPRNFTLTKKTTASLSLRWNPVTREHRGGVIRGYVVEYTSLATTPTGAQTKATFVCAEKLSLDLKGLRVFTRYLVTVGAFTSAGKGPLAAINETTKQLGCSFVLL